MSLAWRPLLVASLAAVLTVPGLPGIQPDDAPVADAADKPNIVVFLLDDTSPHDGRLWGASDELGHDPTLTPAIYDHFIANGVHFPNAISETPLCCPARINLVTGLHTHNNGVKVNDARLFNPDEHLGHALGEAGYETFWIGKYLNKTDLLTPDQFLQHSAGWSEFDVYINPVDDRTFGYFYNYTLFTKQGVLTPPEHSTQMIADRAAAHIAATPAETPVFALLSIYNTHAPHLPVPAFVGDPRCDSMPPWNPPNYNEADVSDKPGYVRNRPLYPYADGWPMETMCEEMLGVDWLVQRVTDELAAQGRLDNTLFVFTADNGMDWGEHRLELKQTPYSAPVPLYFSWPAAWGSGNRTIDAYTSNIDLAPTLCGYAGCTLGPFPGGQSGPDGLSLKPLLEGNQTNLERDALLETNHDSREWLAVRTTDQSDLGLWHYVENSDGFKELYNLEDDEYELENVVGDPAFSEIRSALRSRLIELLEEGRPDGATATIKIVQDSVPNGGQDFSYTSDLGNFTLDDDYNATLPRARKFTGLTPGSYTFEIGTVPGFTLTTIKCPPLSATDIVERRATVQVLPGDSITCTFKSIKRRPDASIANSPLGPFKTDNFYRAKPVKKQTRRHDDALAGQTYEFLVNLQNDGKQPDSFTVGAVVEGSATMTTQVFADELDVTGSVLAGTYTTPALATGASVRLVVRVQVGSTAPASSKSKIVLTARSTSEPSAVDVVRGVVKR